MDSGNAENINIDVENFSGDVEELPESKEKIKKDSSTKKPESSIKSKPSSTKSSKQDSCLVEIIDQGLMFALNEAYLNKKEDEKVTALEIRGTNFSSGVVSTVNKYFPDWDLDHPIVQVAFSLPMIVLLLNGKKGKNKTQVVNNDEAINAKSVHGEGRVSDVDEERAKRSSGDSETDDSNPYLKS